MLNLSKKEERKEQDELTIQYKYYIFNFFDVSYYVILMTFVIRWF